MEEQIALSDIAVARARGKTFSEVLPFVTSSLAALTCLTTPGKTAACNKEPIDGFPRSSRTVGAVLPSFLPNGRTVLPGALRFCRAHWAIAMQVERRAVVGLLRQIM